MFSGMSKSTRLFRLAFQRGLRHAFSLPPIQLRDRCCLMAMRRNSKQTSETEANSTACMGASRHGRGGRVVRGRSSGSDASSEVEGQQEQTSEDREQNPIVEASEAYRGGTSGASLDSQRVQSVQRGADGTDVAADAGPRSTTRTTSGRAAESSTKDTEIKGYHGGKGEEGRQATGAGSSDRKQSGLPDFVHGVQQRCDLQHHEQLEESRAGLQVEAPVAHAASEGSRGGSGSQPSQTMEAKSEVGDAHARTASGFAMGPSRIGQTTMLEPQDVLVGNDGDGPGEGVPEEGLLKPADPNAPTMREQARRGRDRVDLVLGSRELLPEDQGGDGRAQDDPLEGSESDASAPEVFHQGDSGHVQLPGEARKLTLNRRQRRSILQGVKRGIATHRRIYEVAAAQPHAWTLLEVFAGCANLTKVATNRPKWKVLPAQDVKYGLDLTLEEHQELLKDLIRTQQPDVITLSPPCGPWSTWQRMRKKRGVLLG